MTFAFPDGLAPEVFPLAWIVGRWQGEGVLDYPGIPKADIRKSVVIDHDGGPYLRYFATVTLVGADGEDGDVWSSETGYWRISPQVPEDMELAEGQHPVELVLADGAGSIALFIGAVGNGRIDLASDLMARTASAPDVGGATRLYGSVGGDLLWAWDIAAFGNPLQSYASGRLTRMPTEESADGAPAFP